MWRDSQISLLTCVIVILATPATIGLSLYSMTGDQRYRPLGLSDNGLGFFTSTGTQTMQIEVTLHWAPSDGHRDAAMKLGRDIKGTFEAKGVEAIVYVQEDPQATSSFVIYDIGRNEIGPFSIGEAIDGVRPAVDAIRAFQRTYPERFEPDI